MKNPTGRRPSLVIVSRMTFALIVLGVALFSFAVGYLVAYQLAAPVIGERVAINSGDIRPALPPEEKRVLDAPPAQAPLQAVQPPQATEPVKPAEPSVPVQPAVPEKEKPSVPQPEPKQPEAKPAPEKAVDAGGKKQRAKEMDADTTKKATDRQHYIVELGSFSDPARADVFKADLVKKGVKAYVVPKTDKNPYTRVRSGKFSNLADAKKHAEKIKDKTGVSGRVIKR
ncbi:MAG TPA: SPOR domain-containing protein [Dissulfurispiraceae bacterium]|nr:SPOR domain-containing protein [Dissulfurispiraceae bacterium]